MADYKKLCAELVEKLDELNCHYNVPNQSAIIERAHAALAEPEPEGPTKDELWELWLRLNNELPDRPAAVAEFWEHARVHTRALARWSNSPAPQPIPVSERLPGPKDCDAEGRCWWLKERANPDHDLLMPTWHLQRQGPAGTRFFRFTHWLPAHALPLPEEVA
jgi:hypothetical protein